MQEIAKSGRSLSPTPATDTATEEEEEEEEEEEDTCITVYYAHEGLHYNHAYFQYYVISIMCVISILIVSHINLF